MLINLKDDASPREDYRLTKGLPQWAARSTSRAPHTASKRATTLTRRSAWACIALSLLWLTFRSDMLKIKVPFSPAAKEDVPSAASLMTSSDMPSLLPQSSSSSGTVYLSSGRAVWGQDFVAADLLTGLLPYPHTTSVSEYQALVKSRQSSDGGSTDDDNDSASSVESPAPLSDLGGIADAAYSLLPLDFSEHLALLVNYIHAAVPPVWRRFYEQATMLSVLRLERLDVGWDVRKRIWQTEKTDVSGQTDEVRSWTQGRAKEERWELTLLTDDKADQWIMDHFRDSLVQRLWEALPSPILRADTLRYILMAFHGGIYTDVDTTLIRPPSQWGRGATLWRDGKGWTDETDRQAILAIPDDEPERRDREMDRRLGRANVVVSLEGDLSERQDWLGMYPRPASLSVQITQWTMASTPFHPIPLLALLKIQHATAASVQWSQHLAARLKSAQHEGNATAVHAIEDEYRAFENGCGNVGPRKIMNWTGPGVWTDAVVTYLRARYGFEWTDLRGLQKPLRVGDVIILPSAGFNTWNPEEEQAMVRHGYRGSWKSHVDDLTVE